MSTLPSELAPLFWEQSGITQDDLESGRVRDLGARLQQFLSTECLVEPVRDPADQEIVSGSEDVL